MIGFQSIIHQGWFFAKIGKAGENPYPQFVNSGRKDEGFQTSAFGEFERGVRLFQDGKPWKEAASSV
jgi:hypothetical protein